MNKVILFFIILLIGYQSSGQDIRGKWNAVLNVQNIQLRLVFHIDSSKNGFTSTMDSPDQAAMGIRVDSTSFENLQLRLSIPNLGVEYKGKWEKKELITGVFKQYGQSFPLHLTRKQQKAETFTRPQEPKRPYPYLSENIRFLNSRDSISLAGTLTLPSKGKKFPAVLLISGSGPQNRNSELFGHKPFLVLADHLTKNGIAVLRFDDRGTGESEGKFATATSADLTKDAEAALVYLQSRNEIDPQQIGLLGHSEGGIIAPMIASKTEVVAFVVLLAAPALHGDKLLLLQKETTERRMGINEVAILQSKTIFKEAYKLLTNTKTDAATRREQLTAYFTSAFGTTFPKERMHSLVQQLTSPWMLYFLAYNPSLALQKLRCPVLVLNGSKDVQVPPKENLQKMREILQQSKNTNASIIELKQLNHLFQESKTGLPSEYSKIEQTFSPTALEIISKWVLEHSK